MAFENRVGKTQSRREKGHRQQYKYSQWNSHRGGGQAVCLEVWGEWGAKGAESRILRKLKSESPGRQPKEVGFILLPVQCCWRVLSMDSKKPKKQFRMFPPICPLF